MEKFKKEFYEKFIKAAEKATTKKGELLVDKMFELLYAEVKENFNLDFVTVSVADARQAVADYINSEGCSCCAADNHTECEDRLAELLKPQRHKDDSGWDWTKEATER
jgi:selenocysteine lyase/cysteine desulfurase